jgi:hypothetical protein
MATQQAALKQDHTRLQGQFDKESQSNGKLKLELDEAKSEV